MNVYRGDTAGRTRKINVNVPAAALAPPHLYYHPSVNNEPAFYEVVGPEILRIAMMPNEVVPFSGRTIAPDLAKQKVFNYVVLGHADTVDGLAAPYDEEATEEIMLLEELPTGVDIFSFWKANANTDLIANRKKETRKLEGP